MRSPLTLFLQRCVTVLLVGLIVTPVALTHAPSVATAASLAEQLGIPAENIPPDVGQTQLQVFVPETGHTVRGYMLDYWRVNGAQSVYGSPISEAYGAPNQLYSQAFERGIFQYQPSMLYTDDAVVSLAPVGTQMVNEQRTTTRTDGRRTGGDRRSASWRSGSENPTRSAAVANEGGRYSNATGKSISGGYAQWYDSHEGWFYLGAPLSEPMRIRGVEGQIYQNGVLLNQGGLIQPAPMPRENPARYGIDTTPVAQGDLPAFSEALFYSNPNPYGVDPTTVGGPKRIEVSISEQVMRVYQGDTLILETLVSTGIEPNHTEIGFFHVRMKFKEQTMEGFTDSSGEVVGLGNDSSVEGTQTSNAYSVEDVPDVMYINYQAEALHGAYWHNNFGTRMSHGCINQPLDVAAFMFDFAPVGTPVTVFE